MELEAFNVQFDYIKGSNNILADTLSRLIAIDPDTPTTPEEQGYEFGYAIVTSTVFESKDEPTQMTKQSFTIIDFITFRKSIHFKLICKNVHN